MLAPHIRYAWHAIFDIDVVLVVYVSQPHHAKASDIQVDVLKHYKPQTWSDKIAYRTVRSLRVPSDLFFQVMTNLERFLLLELHTIKYVCASKSHTTSPCCNGGAGVIISLYRMSFWFRLCDAMQWPLQISLTNLINLLLEGCCAIKQNGDTSYLYHVN